MAAFHKLPRPGFSGQVSWFFLLEAAKGRVMVCPGGQLSCDGVGRFRMASIGLLIRAQQSLFICLSPF